jgi:dienelactone hydrolase
MFHLEAKRRAVDIATDCVNRSGIRAVDRTMKGGPSHIGRVRLTYVLVFWPFRCVHAQTHDMRTQRFYMRLAAASVALFGFVVLANAAPAASAVEEVEFTNGDLTLKATLIRPEGDGPFPAVVGLHGCEGLTSRAGSLETRYRDWAQHLVRAGFAVLFPDSYGSRGLGSQCAMRNRPVRVDRERVADANAARHWLQKQSWIKPERISLIGWSTGGVSTLWAVRPRRALKDDGQDFRSAVAFYPGCRRLDATAWSARIPTLILAAGADDWSPVSSCEHMVAGARGRSAHTAIVVYPGAYQDFDHPNRALQLRSNNAFSIDGSGNVHSGTNPTARADALKRVPQWLAR